MKTTATENIYRLVDFAIDRHLVSPIDRSYTVNRLLEIMQMDAPEDIEYEKSLAPETATPRVEASWKAPTHEMPLNELAHRYAPMNESHTT